MPPNASRFLAAGAACLAALVLNGAPAGAHEIRQVGDLTFFVGWGEEPPTAGFRNSAQLVVWDADNNPVADLGDDWKVVISTGDHSQPFAIRPSFVPGIYGVAGDYRAVTIPTRPGTYTFRITGRYKGVQFDESFTTVEPTIPLVRPPSDLAFPVVDPSVGDISERIDTALPRIEGTADAAADDVKQARLVAIAAGVMGAVGLVLAGFALARRRPVS